MVGFIFFLIYLFVRFIIYFTNFCLFLIKELRIMTRTILHIDLNNFYASVECLYNPQLRNIPLAVAGDPANRHGIILAKNMAAKSSASRQAKQFGKRSKKPPLQSVFLHNLINIYVFLGLPEQFTAVIPIKQNHSVQMNAGWM